MARPVGHVTWLIKRVERWMVNRQRLSLPVGDLKMVVAYLTEYRDLLNEMKR